MDTSDSTLDFTPHLPVSERSERINDTVRFAERSEATLVPAPPKAVPT